jgi:hypothetical protein
MRLIERFVECSTSLTRCATMFIPRTVVYADNEGLVFHSESFYDNLNEEPFVDAAPASDHSAVTGLTFATPVCSIRDQFTDGHVFDNLICIPVFDTYLANLDDASVFDIDHDDFDNGPSSLTPASHPRLPPSRHPSHVRRNSSTRTVVSCYVQIISGPYMFMP